MASNVPIVRQIAWISLIPQILLLGIFIYVFYLLKTGDPFLLGALTLLILSFSLKIILTGDHRQGIKSVKQGKFAEAIPFYQKSAAYFSGNAWVDKYRFLTMLSSSKMTYREMGLCNIAFCYSQLGDGAKAREFFEQALKDYPENGIATSALKMLDSADNTTL